MTQPGQPGYDPTIEDWAKRYDVAENPLRHGIDTSVTGGAFASVRNPAWHQLGVVKTEQCSALELLQAAHADYPILRAPIRTGELEVEIPTVEGMPPMFVKYADAVDERRTNICRVHPETGQLQILGQASKDYPLWTPRDVLVGFGDAILGTAKPNVSTCGVLDDGRRVFMSFELPEAIKISSELGEYIRLWLVVHTSFDTNTPTYANLTPLRPVCANTLRVGVREQIARYTIRKTKNADLQAAQAREALGLVKAFTEELVGNATKLLQVKVSKDLFVDIIRRNWGPADDADKKTVTKWEEKENQLVGLFSTADTQANVRGTAWAALQAVTEERDWFSKVNGSKGKTEGELDAIRFRRSLEFEKSVTDPKDLMFKELMALA